MVTETLEEKWEDLEYMYLAVPLIFLQADPSSTSFKGYGTVNFLKLEIGREFRTVHCSDSVRYIHQARDLFSITQIKEEFISMLISFSSINPMIN